jgi:NAD(P)-dependent dehydrogenase (short-subunit alcohol dehydrogenase family)
VAEQADVRDFNELKSVVAQSVSELGRLDFVLANAGIAPHAGEQSHGISAYRDAVDVMLNGVYFTIEAALPAMLKGNDGGAIVITSSAFGFKPFGVRYGSMSHGTAGYTAAKHGVVGLMRYYATSLAEKNIRVNSVHPGGVATPMTQSPASQQFIAKRPDFAAAQRPLLPVGLLDPQDITAAVLYLCAESGRYVTGVTLPVDGGLILK